MDEGRLYIEKRQHIRVDKKYKVKYKVLGQEDDLEKIKGIVAKKQGGTENISLGGARIEGEMKAKQGDIIRVEIFVEGNEKPVTTFAEIKWLDTDASKNNFGIEFITLNNQDRKVITEIIGE